MKGLLWDENKKKTRKRISVKDRPMPKIKSKWRALAPADWPNYRHAKKIAIDVETYDPNLLSHGPGYARHDGHLVGISAAVSKTEFIYLPMRHEVKPKHNCDPEKVLLWAKDNLTSPDVQIIGANLQYDVGWLREENVLIKGSLLDVQIVEKLIDENLFNYTLDSLSKRYLQMGKVSDKLYQWLSDYYGGKVNSSQRKNIHKSPPSICGPYAEADAWLPFEIWKKQKKIIKQQHLQLVLNLECKFTKILLDMRFRGVGVDIPYAERMKERLILLEEKEQKTLDKIAGRHTRFNASASIAKSYNKLNLSYKYTEEGNPSFTKLNLQNCDHEIAKQILKIREINKIRSTFIENAILNKHINGRIYGTFNQLGTRSGRLSAKLPNLQQAPSRTILGKELRRCFIPNYDDGCEHWYRADVSQIQYRGLAHHAVGKGANDLRKKYINDPTTDFHNATKTLIKEVTNITLNRKSTKNINFGLMFGMMKKKLIKTLGLSDKKGNDLFNAYHKGVPFVQTTFDYCEDLVQRNGFICTKLGRRSRFNKWCEPYGKEYFNNKKETIDKFGKAERAFAYKALVMLVQGEEADFIKGAMIKCHEDGIFDALGGPPELIVHDEIDGSCNIENDCEALLLLKKTMQNSASYKVPILIDLEVGVNWRDCEKIT